MRLFLLDNEQFKGKLVHEGYIVEQSEAETLMNACKAAGTATIKEWAVNDKKRPSPSIFPGFFTRVYE